jgi:hypothetical protein
VPNPAVPDLGVFQQASSQPGIPAATATQIAAETEVVSPEPRTKKDRQRKERDVSMAELARDIISISEHESGPSDGADAAGNEEQGAGATQFESDRQASFDLMIGRAPKGGRLRRPKGLSNKDAADESEGFDPMNELGTSPELDPSASKGRFRGRLGHR